MSQNDNRAVALIALRAYGEAYTKAKDAAKAADAAYAHYVLGSDQAVFFHHFGLELDIAVDEAKREAYENAKAEARIAQVEAHWLEKRYLGIAKVLSTDDLLWVVDNYNPTL